jgi:amidase
VTDLCLHTAIELAGMLRRRAVSAREVIAAHISRIEKHDAAVNAVVTRTFERATAQAAQADEELAHGRLTGLLHGLPVAHKDLAETAGVRTTFGSPLFADNVPARDALVVQRMAAAGAISLGKTNVPEWGSGSHTVNPVARRHLQPVGAGPHRGRQQRRAAAAPGGPDGLARPTAATWRGSLRNPAGFANAVGLRPSPGRVPAWLFSDVEDQLAPLGDGQDRGRHRPVAGRAVRPDLRIPMALDQPAPASRTRPASPAC